jgi:hypothetical protein
VLAAAVTCLAVALSLDLAGVSPCVPDGFGLAGLVFLAAAVIFPRRPGGDP